MVGRLSVVQAGIAPHLAVDCERIHDWSVGTMAVHRDCSGFGRNGCLLGEKKASIHIGNSFRVHNREQILARPKVLGR